MTAARELPQVPVGTADITIDHVSKITTLHAEIRESLARNSSAGALIAVDELRSVLDQFRSELKSRFIADLAELLAVASGNSATHTWAEPDGGNFRCTACRLEASPMTVRMGAVPICIPDADCQHFATPLWDSDEGSSLCRYCDQVYPSTAESERVR